ncbi:membrane-associated progesterone receptor component 2-like isoform X2 [Bradysia coprophila]|uniref:membrane-associated progesterone receptor component 2-like isoform X2 n=1 Tax=Bradysia coprophila TaxID=38358 RepID=UPI00187DAC8C|nr:membrane-associated progesterone receptor component 2-like isoform X2 [Bradysia coprophila]
MGETTSRNSNVTPPRAPKISQLPKIRKDFTVQELKEFDGNPPDGRILLAINGRVYDVTKGRRFYGPGGPYAAFGGRDVSRDLATLSVTNANMEGYDDLSDLSSKERDSVQEWELQFKKTYEYVGCLLKPGEEPANYSDHEDYSQQVDSNTNDKPSDSTASTGKLKDD